MEYRQLIFSELRLAAITIGNGVPFAARYCASQTMSLRSVFPCPPNPTRRILNSPCAVADSVSMLSAIAGQSSMGCCSRKLRDTMASSRKMIIPLKPVGLLMTAFMNPRRR